MYVCMYVLYRLVRRVDNYLDSAFIVLLYYDPTITGFDSQSGHYSATDATVSGIYGLCMVCYNYQVEHSLSVCHTYDKVAIG